MDSVDTTDKFQATGGGSLQPYINSLSSYVSDDEISDVFDALTDAIQSGYDEDELKELLDNLCFEYTGFHLDELEDEGAAEDEDTARAIEALNSFAGIQKLAESVEGGEKLLEALSKNNLGEGTLNGGALPFSLREALSNEPDVLGSWPGIINDFYKNETTGDPEEDKKIHEMQNSIIKKDVNSDGDTDVVEADTDGDGKKDTAAVSAESKGEKKEAEKEASDDLKEDKKKEIDSTGNTTVSSKNTKDIHSKVPDPAEGADKDEFIAFSREERIKKHHNGWDKTSTQKKNEGTDSDIRIKNIVGALRDRRF